MTLRASGKIFRRALAIALIAAFGIARAPLESALSREMFARGLQQRNLDLSMRDQLGQQAFVAALGGFRSLVASILHLQAYSAWEEVDWGRLQRFYEIITRLQPRSIFYWDDAAWHLAYNATANVLNNPDFEESTRSKLWQGYLGRGRGFLEDGIVRIPESYRLHAELGRLYADRLKYNDPCKAAEAYRGAIDKPGVPAYIVRNFGYNLARCPGNEKEALAFLMECHARGPKWRKPTLITLIKKLEEELNVPQEERISTPPNPG